jgi:hypothetical protein
MKICFILALFLLPVSLYGASQPQSIATISTVDIDAVVIDNAHSLTVQPRRHHVIIARPSFGRFWRGVVCCSGVLLTGFMIFIIYVATQDE